MSYELGVVVLDRGDHLLFLRVPPFVRHDAVTVAVSAGEQRGVSGSGAGVGIVVVAVGEVGAVVEEKAESAFAELVAVALQIVAAKLVDDDHHDQLGMGVVGGGESGRDGSENEGSYGRQRNTPAHAMERGGYLIAKVVYTVGRLGEAVPRRSSFA